ncbi:MAG: DUF2442 domain-containing protein [Candidatus Omnitrophota bacterium]|jgi:hypothetical protein|nr:MAG: DUF2442 domain-containing protein [Candidatus Omnitrophota bacterium]
MDDFPKIISVQPGENRCLFVAFENGTVKNYDCTPLFHTDAFTPLKEKWFFKTVKVDVGGYGVSWNDEIDLSEAELWKNGTVVEGNRIIEQ